MKQDLRVLTAAGSLLLAASVGEAAFVQKQGGILRMSHFDSPRACRCTRKRPPPPIGR